MPDRSRNNNGTHQGPGHFSGRGENGDGHAPGGRHPGGPRGQRTEGSDPTNKKHFPPQFAQNGMNEQVPPPPFPENVSQVNDTTASSSTAATGILSGIAGLGVGAAAGSIITSIIKDKEKESDQDAVNTPVPEPTAVPEQAASAPAKCPYCGGNVDEGLTACPYCDSRLC